MNSIDLIVFCCIFRNEITEKTDTMTLTSMSLTINGMKCSSCENKIKCAVSEIPGVNDVSVIFLSNFIKKLKKNVCPFSHFFFLNRFF